MSLAQLNTGIPVIKPDRQEIPLNNTDNINVDLPYIIKTLICVHVDGASPAIIDRYNYFRNAENNSTLLIHFAETYNTSIRLNIVYIGANEK